MQEYNKNGINFKYKNYLNEDEFIKIIKIYIKNLVEGLDNLKDEIPVTSLNYILADIIFDRTLGLYCVENFNEDIHKKIFEAGLYDFLKEDIKNANRAYNLAKEIVRNSSSLEEIIREFLTEFIKKIPEDINIDEMKNLWSKVSGEYKNIVGTSDGE